MNRREGNILKDYLELSKIKVMIPVSLTGLTGYFIYKSEFSPALFFVTAGILFLAVAASVLNQLQEVQTDNLMERTRNRPLPAGRISPENAWVFFVISFITGTLFIIATGSTSALIISYLTLAWYNGVYTYLKKLTAFAVLPGALTGALPPLIGWVAAGGSASDRTILVIQLLFFIGQIPHFWLFMLKYGNQYGEAGLPHLTAIMERTTIKRLIFVWIVASACMSGCLYFFAILKNRMLIAMLLTASLFLVTAFIRLIPGNVIIKPGKYSILLNFYYLLIMILLISDRLIPE
jgi:protoheme IX farnesyltransferase